jgi:hypothetical protein
MVLITIIVIVLAILGIGSALRSPTPPPMTSADSDLLDYCPHCGTVAIPQYRKSGSTILEVLLWLFFLVPGIIYSIWRASTRCWVCPKCDHTGTIPVDSPNAQAALKDKRPNPS